MSPGCPLFHKYSTSVPFEILKQASSGVAREPIQAWASTCKLDNFWSNDSKCINIISISLTSPYKGIKRCWQLTCCRRADWLRDRGKAAMDGHYSRPRYSVYFCNRCAGKCALTISAITRADWWTYLSLDVDGRYLHIQAAREDFALFRYRVRHISGYVVAARLCVRTVVNNRESSVVKICNGQWTSSIGTNHWITIKKPVFGTAVIGTDRLEQNLCSYQGRSIWHFSNFLWTW